MATESIIKNVIIKNDKSIKRFISALELAKKRKSKTIIFHKNVINLNEDQVKEFFS